MMGHVRGGRPRKQEFKFDSHCAWKFFGFGLEKLYFTTFFLWDGKHKFFRTFLHLAQKICAEENIHFTQIFRRGRSKTGDDE